MSRPPLALVPDAEGSDAGARPLRVDSGLECLCLIARLHSLPVEATQIAHEFRAGDGMVTAEILLAARKLGLSAKAVRVNAQRLAKLTLPAVAIGSDGGYVVLAKMDGERYLIHDPVSQRPEVREAEAFSQWWSGELILFASRASLGLGLAKFDFTWFIPAVIKYRKLLGEVLVVSFVLQLIALVTPLFFQVVMDKVLVHRGFTTLDVIAVGLLIVTAFDVVLTVLRTYLFSHTTSRIDVELGARLFRHLLSLPLAYFAARRVGDSVARVRELESIRSFLTGNAVTLLLDLLFSVVFLAVMCYYSMWLTLIVAISLPCYVLLSVGWTPLLRARLHEKFNRGAENQAFLVETISGIDTVKAMAVEPQWTRKWDGQLAAYVSAGFRTTTISTLANGGVTLVSKLVTVATMYFGAKLVIDGQLSVGQLVAFNMLAGQVAQPVMRLAQLWTDFQQTGISVQRLGDILNAHPETGAGKPPLPPVRGGIDLDEVVFRYRPDMPEILRGVRLSVAPGEIIGIVGRSGSGKSTLTKLVQQLYVPERGRILVDGIDLAMVDATSLRRQIGVVLQDNTLFARSVRENIALADPGAPLEAVVRAARLAGAHDFITELPEGYNTLVGEHGATLSGGQRQRIAIARALMADPRILIFDEATSALDYESERIIQDNMKSICRGRTVLIIAHRLSAVRDAHRIIVMERGQIVETGSHDELLATADGHYARLHALQAG